MFSCEFCVILKNIHFVEHLRTAAFEFLESNFLQTNIFTWESLLLVSYESTEPSKPLDLLDVILNNNIIISKQWLH